MSQLDIHPEHLMDRVLQGQASLDERSELHAHLGRCPACSAEWQLAQVLRDTEHDAPAAVGGTVDAVLARVAQDRSQPTAAATRTRWASMLPWVAGACLFFAGSAAAATLIVALRAAPQPPAAASAVASAATAEKKRRAPRMRASLSPAPESALVEEARVSPEPPAAPGAQAAPAMREADSDARGKPTQPARPAPSAAQLFAQARQAARGAEHAEASALYLRLQARHPHSSEAQVSHVMLGRIYLEQLHDPRAALVHFDAYLERGGPNEPEAWMGRARALRTLGRARDEAAALRRLIADHPDSLYVGSAATRLRSLE